MALTSRGRLPPAALDPPHCGTGRGKPLSPAPAQPDDREPERRVEGVGDDGRHWTRDGRKDWGVLSSTPSRSVAGGAPGA